MIFKIPTQGIDSDLYELDAADRLYFRRVYRVLRIRVPYAAPGSAQLDGSRHSGHSYGMTRDEAKRTIFDLAHHVNWYGYLGSK